jgi:2-polyprenyl-3-methyl-5-hydroxy-6-metoxy-1,4-benzoquinol methylase
MGSPKRCKAVNTERGNGADQVAELTAIIEAVRERVRARYPEPARGSEPAGNGTQIRVPVADLMPVVHARDAAQAKIAAIGNVNPRAGGAVNQAIQAVKRTIARGLAWFVRDQVTFNRETVSAIESILEALNDHNRIMVSLAAQANEQIARMSDEVDRLQPEIRELKDIRAHWATWRTEWERKLAANEIQFLRSVADLQGAFQHRCTLMESNFREIVQAQHRDYLGALDRATIDIQKRLWSDLREIREEYEHLIHNELRVIRQRAFVTAGAESGGGQASSRERLMSAPALADFDYGRFAERFRGSEEYVQRNLEFYRTFFEDRRNVLDVGCGRGEFLEAMRELGVTARGIDIAEDSVALCRHKGLMAETADLFPFLAAQPEGEFDGIFSAQVVEHLAPERLPEMIRLCTARLRRGGLLAIETPNPECLAIFATHFYLDPTHTRPVPHPLLAFYMEEAGLGLIEVHRLSPALDSIPEIAELPERFRDRFFGGLDYAIIGRKL